MEITDKQLAGFIDHTITADIDAATIHLSCAMAVDMT